MRLFFFKFCCPQSNIILIFLLSLSCSKRFLLTLPPGLNCGNDNLLSITYKILEPNFETLYKN